MTATKVSVSYRETKIPGTPGCSCLLLKLTSTKAPKDLDDQQAMQHAARPNQIFKPDPLLGWRLSPDCSIKMEFRPSVVQTINAEGWRNVPGAPDTASRNVGVYGCSFTYGTGLSDAETYVAQLQSDFGQVRFLNRGIGGHGSVQNYLQFRRDVKKGLVDTAIFGIISDHRFRNVPHPQRMRQFRNRHWYEKGIERVPTARMTREDTMVVEYVPIWQPALEGSDFEVFLPDERMIDLATFQVLRSICDFAKTHAIPVSLALLDQLDLKFNVAVLESFPAAVDVSTPYDDAHTFMPHDLHPNPAANRLFAERLKPVLKGLISGSGA